MIFFSFLIHFYFLLFQVCFSSLIVVRLFVVKQFPVNKKCKNVKKKNDKKNIKNVKKKNVNDNFSEIVPKVRKKVCFLNLGHVAEMNNLLNYLWNLKQNKKGSSRVIEGDKL